MKGNYLRKKASWKVLEKKYRETPVGRAKVLFHSAKTRASNMLLDFDLTKDWVTSRCVSGVCEVTGLPFSFKSQCDRRNLLAPSIDRTDAMGNYTQDNCKLVVLGYNLAKCDGNHEDVMAISRALVKKENELLGTPPDLM